MSALQRNNRQLELTKKYLFICEGMSTEPDYIDGVIRNRFNLGIDPILELNSIPKLKMDMNESDLGRLIKIAKDYVNYCVNGVMSRRLAVTLTFESAYEKLLESTQFNIIKNDNTSLRSLRNEIDSKLDAAGISNDEVVDSDLHKLCLVCRDVFKDHYGLQMDDCLKPSSLKKMPIVEGDIICIIHDRDYNSKYFSDAKYKDACHKIDTLNRGGIHSQLIITYPKFEFWMLMHSPNIDVSKLNYSRLKQYPGTSKYVDDLIDSNLDIWIKGSKKRIDPRKFDLNLGPNINRAIANSYHPKLVTNVIDLCNNPGTSMGKLMDELINPSHFHNNEK